MFFRYPGGKRKIKGPILERLKSIWSSHSFDEYREPFFGGGSIGINLIKEISLPEKIWINDVDPGISAVWTSVISYPTALTEIVSRFTPSVEAFEAFKSELLGMIEPPFTMTGIVSCALSKIAVHQMSFSGLGTKSGGPLGGKTQSSDYKVDCRWSPDYMCDKIMTYHKMLAPFDIRNKSCTCLDFEEVVLDTKTKPILYLDPPYYKKGPDLYQFSFSSKDHRRLAELLREVESPWLLSYDDHTRVRQLYDWAYIEELDSNYTIAGARQKKELLIYRKDF